MRRRFGAACGCRDGGEHGDGEQQQAHRLILAARTEPEHVSRSRVVPWAAEDAWQALVRASAFGVACHLPGRQLPSRSPRWRLHAAEALRARDGRAPRGIRAGCGVGIGERARSGHAHDAVAAGLEHGRLARARRPRLRALRCASGTGARLRVGQRSRALPASAAKHHAAARPQAPQDRHGPVAAGRRRLGGRVDATGVRGSCAALPARRPAPRGLDGPRRRSLRGFRRTVRRRPDRGVPLERRDAAVRPVPLRCGGFGQHAARAEPRRRDVARSGRRYALVAVRPGGRHVRVPGRAFRGAAGFASRGHGRRGDVLRRALRDRAAGVFGAV